LFILPSILIPILTSWLSIGNLQQAVNQNWLTTIPKTTAPVVVAAASSMTGGTGWTVLSIANAWDSSRHVTEFLEGLKNREAGREGIPFAPLDASIY
jgi:hypothetical protein